MSVCVSCILFIPVSFSYHVCEGDLLLICDNHLSELSYTVFFLRLACFMSYVRTYIQPKYCIHVCTWAVHSILLRRRVTQFSLFDLRLNNSVVMRHFASHNKWKWLSSRWSTYEQYAGRASPPHILSGLLHNEVVWLCAEKGLYNIAEPVT